MPQIKRQSQTGEKPKTGTVIDRIQQIGFDEDEGIKLLLYGRSGTGKTTLWSTFPGQILAMIRSGGKRPGELRSINTVANRKRIKTVNINDPTEVDDLCNHQENTGNFSTLVLDHASGLQDLVLQTILGIDEMPVQKSWGLATQQQYGICTAQCKEHFRRLLDLKCNVVIVAQERGFNDNDEGSDLILPYVGAALTPSLAGWLNPACDYIGNTFLRQKTKVVESKIGTGPNAKTMKTTQKIDGVDYCLRVGPNSVFTTKFRVPRGVELPDAIVDPDYQKIIKLIQGG